MQQPVTKAELRAARRAERVERMSVIEADVSALGEQLNSARAERDLAEEGAREAAQDHLRTRDELIAELEALRARLSQKSTALAETTTAKVEAENQRQTLTLNLQQATATVTELEVKVSSLETEFEEEINLLEEELAQSDQKAKDLGARVKELMST